MLIIQESTKKFGHYTFRHDWRRKKDDGLMYFVNKEKIARNKAIMKKALKRILKEFWKRKTIMRVSLPIIVCSDDTILHRLAKGKTFCAHYLFLASKEQDPVE